MKISSGGISVIAIAAVGALLLPLAGAHMMRAREAPSPSQVVTRQVEGVTRASLAAALREAGTFLASHKGTRFVLQLPPGDIDLSGPGGVASIDFSNLDACPGELILRGRGIGRTTIVKDDDLIGMAGTHTSCLTIADLTIKQARREVSQGTVISVNADQIDVDVPPGFPGLDDLALPATVRDYNGRPIRWMKRYVLADGAPEAINEERAVHWTGAEAVTGSPRRWSVRISVGRAGAPKPKPGDLVSFTAKSGGQMYRFTDGHDITFDAVQWIGDSRGKFRRVDRVTVRNNVVRAPAPINGVAVALATSAGGPQIGHPGDPITIGHVLENNVFERLGDDAIAMANASGIIRNNRISDSAARGILIVGDGQVILQNNTLIRAPVLRKAIGGTERRRRPCTAEEACTPR